MHTTRESWLAAAVALVRPRVETFAGARRPARIRIACGFPSTFTRSGTLAECWADTESADSTFEVLISPTLADPASVLAQVLGAIAHTAPGAMSPTSNAYATLAIDLGLCPAGDSWRQVQGSEDFAQTYAQALQYLGAYPHAAILTGSKKTQTTRMLKLTCPLCGYTIRTSGKWIATGLPVCHDGTEFQADAATEGEEQ
jgi:hypothetical protein